VVDVAVEEVAFEDETERPHGVAELEVGSFLVQGRAPNRDGLTEARLPDELVHGGVKAHADRRAVDGAEATGDEAKCARSAELGKALLGAKLARGVGALWLELAFRAILVHDLVRGAVDARRRKEDQPTLRRDARFGDALGSDVIHALDFFLDL